MKVMSKVLLVANADSPLLVDRVQMSAAGPYETVWYSESAQRPVADCRVYHYRKRVLLGPLNKFCATFFFLYVYWRERPDILHIHWALFFPLLLRRRWKNLIVSVMGSDVNLPGRFGSRRFFARLAFARAVAITSKSASMDQAIQRLQGQASRIRRFTWGVSDEFFCAKQWRDQVCDGFGIPRDAMVIFSPRAMQPLYRIPDIVRSFLVFAAEHPKAHLVLAGMSPAPAVCAEIEVMLAGSDLARRVLRLERLDQAGMIDCYAAADVVISYARHDGMPQSLYEAMAVGCFPIFTDLSCYHELLVQQENALLCDSDDPQSITRMLESYQKDYYGDRVQQIVLTNRNKIQQLAARSAEQKRLWALYDELSSCSSDKVRST